MNVKTHLQKRAGQVDAALGKLLPNGKVYPPHLAKAMRYSVFSGGKRVRPFLVLEASKLCGGTESNTMPLACAVEMVHAYSLVHDDLPAMDDDDMRRGKKTCHKAFDEATAILTGDALLSLAFQVISEAKMVKKVQLQSVIQIFSQAIGPYGMVGGQAADLNFQNKVGGTQTLASLKKINELKTGALIRACVELGVLWVGGSKAQVSAARKYGEQVGLLFQLVDDIIDDDGYTILIGKEKTYQKALRVRDEAKKSLKIFGIKGKVLSEFTDFLYARKH